MWPICSYNFFYFVLSFILSLSLSRSLSLSLSLSLFFGPSGCYFEGDQKMHAPGTTWHPFVPPFGYIKCALCTCKVKMLNTLSPSSSRHHHPHPYSIIIIIIIIIYPLTSSHFGRPKHKYNKIGSLELRVERRGSRSCMSEGELTIEQRGSRSCMSEGELIGACLLPRALRARYTVRRSHVPC